MRSYLLLVSVAALTACANSLESGGHEVSTGSATKSDDTIHTYTCPDSLGDCVRMAKQQCGEAGYSRVRDPGHTARGMEASSMQSVHIGRSESDIRRRADMASIEGGRMSVRCKTPRK